MDAAEFEAAGLLDLASPNAAGRLELLEHLAGLGISIEAMQRAAAAGSLYAAGSETGIAASPSPPDDPRTPVAGCATLVK